MWRASPFYSRKTIVKWLHHLTSRSSIIVKWGSGGGGILGQGNRIWNFGSGSGGGGTFGQGSRDLRISELSDLVDSSKPSKMTAMNKFNIT